MRVLWIVATCDENDSQPNGRCASNGLAWLRQRMGEFPCNHRCPPTRDQAPAESEQRAAGPLLKLHPIEITEFLWPPAHRRASLHQWQHLSGRLECGTERIVIACTNRLDYPCELIKWLQATYPEIPLALACENWWDGWRRTGLKACSHLSLPWYRWWDGWVAWLQGENPKLFEPVPSDWCFVMDSIGAGATVKNVSGARGVIVGNCRQTRDAWSLAAGQAGYAADCYTPRSFLRHSSDRSHNWKNRWVLWDDSSLDTTPAGDGGDLIDDDGSGNTCVGEPAHRLPIVYETGPDVVLIAALNLPRAEERWSPLVGRGCELLVKPGSGIALQRLLKHHFPF